MQKCKNSQIFFFAKYLIDMSFLLSFFWIMKKSSILKFYNDRADG